MKFLKIYILDLYLNSLNTNNNTRWKRGVRYLGEILLVLRKVSWILQNRTLIWIDHLLVVVILILLPLHWVHFEKKYILIKVLL